MRFIMMYTPDRTNAGPPSKEKYDAIMKSIAEAKQAGTFVSNGGFLPMDKGAIVTLSSGKTTVTDGPYAEAKEVIGGYAIFDLKSKQEAIESAQGFLQLMGGGRVEVRQMVEG